MTAPIRGSLEASPTTILKDNGGPTLLVEDADLLFNGSYARNGEDLVITGRDGSILVIEDYYMQSTPPDLVTREGAVIAPEIAEFKINNGNFDQMAQAGSGGAGLTSPIGKVVSTAGPVTISHHDGTVESAKKGSLVYSD